MGCGNSKGSAAVTEPGSAAPANNKQSEKVMNGPDNKHIEENTESSPKEEIDTGEEKKDAEKPEDAPEEQTGAEESGVADVADSTSPAEGEQKAE